MFETALNPQVVSDAPMTFGAQNRLQSLSIKEAIGDDQLSDSTKFYLPAKASIQFKTKGAIAQLINANEEVVTESDDEYDSNLTATLEAGNYELLFSTEASTLQPFESQLLINYL